MTDPGKDSRAGRFLVLRDGKEFHTVTYEEAGTDRSGDQLETILEDGKLIREQKLEEIREIAASYDTFTDK